jgi:hypothetical protein
MDERDDIEFRRMQITMEIERAEELIETYRTNITFYRKYVDHRQRLLGHLAERLGEPEPEEGERT